MKVINGRQVPDNNPQLIMAALQFLQRPQTTMNGVEAEAFVAVCQLLRAIAEGLYVITDPVNMPIRPDNFSDMGRPAGVVSNGNGADPPEVQL